MRSLWTILQNDNMILFCVYDLVFYLFSGI